ncbi:MAG: hypothetical protein U1E27_01380, partial [Kiritimatiellia bacterium]|nr:hypothetical protein [Kiritimatiellia bacterium]
MIKSFMLSIVFAAGLGFAAENLLPNGDFELGGLEAPVGWKISSMGFPNDGPVVSTEAGFIRGATSVHLKHPATDAARDRPAVVLITERPVPGISAGGEYTISFFARTPVARSGQRLTVFFYAGPSKQPHFYKSRAFTLTENWTKLSFTEKMMTEADWNQRDLFIRFDLPFGEAFLDDVRLERSTPEDSTSAFVTAAGNRIVNPGFELGWMGWGAQPYRRFETDDADPEIPSAPDEEVRYEG